MNNGYDLSKMQNKNVSVVAQKNEQDESATILRPNVENSKKLEQTIGKIMRTPNLIHSDQLLCIRESNYSPIIETPLKEEDVRNISNCKTVSKTLLREKETTKEGSPYPDQYSDLNISDNDKRFFHKFNRGNIRPNFFTSKCVETKVFQNNGNRDSNKNSSDNYWVNSINENASNSVIRSENSKNKGVITNENDTNSAIRSVNNNNKGVNNNNNNNKGVINNSCDQNTADINTRADVFAAAGSPHYKDNGSLTNGRLTAKMAAKLMNAHTIESAMNNVHTIESAMNDGQRISNDISIDERMSNGHTTHDNKHEGINKGKNSSMSNGHTTSDNMKNVKNNSLSNDTISGNMSNGKNSGMSNHNTSGDSINTVKNNSMSDDTTSNESMNSGRNSNQSMSSDITTDEGIHDTIIKNGSMRTDEAKSASSNTSARSFSRKKGITRTSRNNTIENHTIRNSIDAAAVDSNCVPASIPLTITSNNHSGNLVIITSSSNFDPNPINGSSNNDPKSMNDSSIKTSTLSRYNNRNATFGNGSKSCSTTENSSSNSAASSSQSVAKQNRWAANLGKETSANGNPLKRPNNIPITNITNSNNSSINTSTNNGLLSLQTMDSPSESLDSTPWNMDGTETIVENPLLRRDRPKAPCRPPSFVEKELDALREENKQLKLSLEEVRLAFDVSL